MQKWFMGAGFGIVFALHVFLAKCFFFFFLVSAGCTVFLGKWFLPFPSKPYHPSPQTLNPKRKPKIPKF